MERKFIVQVTSGHSTTKQKLLFSMEGTEAGGQHLFTALPGVSKKPKGEYPYELVFSYVQSDILGYREKYLRSEAELLECMGMLLSH